MKAEKLLFCNIEMSRYCSFCYDVKFSPHFDCPATARLLRWQKDFNLTDAF